MSKAFQQGSDGRGRPSVFQRAANDRRILQFPDEPAAEVEGIEVLLTIEQVMGILQVSKSWCYHDRDREQILPWIKVGKHVRLHPEDLKAFITAQRTGGITEVMRRSQGVDTQLEVDLNDYK